MLCRLENQIVIHIVRATGHRTLISESHAARTLMQHSSDDVTDFLAWYCTRASVLGVVGVRVRACVDLHPSLPKVSAEALPCARSCQPRPVRAPVTVPGDDIGIAHRNIVERDVRVLRAWNG